MLTLPRGEMNLIGKFFLFGSPGRISVYLLVSVTSLQHIIIYRNTVGTHKIETTFLTQTYRFLMI